MSDPNLPDDARLALMKKIDGKLAWICFFLILIVLNTCSVADNVGDMVLPERPPAEAPAVPADGA